MAVTEVIPGLWEIKLGFVNAFLHDAGDGLTLVDTGIAGSAGAIVGAIREIGKGPRDLKRIVATHCHMDHAGSLAELKRLTGAEAIMHPIDADMIRDGKAARPLSPSPGFVNGLIVKFLIPKGPRDVEPATIDREVADGEPIPGGLRAIHVPGHCAGQIALFWPGQGGVLLAADACANVFGLSLSPVYEDLAEGRRSLAKLAALSFETAVFGHGKPIKSGASKRFAAKFAG